MQPKLIIHGGLGGRLKFPDKENNIRETLRRIAEEAFAVLQHHAALETVVRAVSLLEDNPLFNAGTGSRLQSDGSIRMTASVMDGQHLRFAGVTNIQNVT